VKPELERKVEEILPQARSEAWKVFQTAPHALDLDELISLAYQGLAQAAQRWPEYCQRRGFDEAALHYFGAYATRRIRGSMLDAMRSDDWVTRSVRSRAKRLRIAGQDLGKTDAEMAEATGLTIEQVRETLAGMSRRPVSMDAEPVDIREADDVEGKAVVNVVLAAAVEAIEALPGETQLVLALHVYGGLEFREIAEVLEIRASRVTQLYAAGVQIVHGAMITSVRES
jgi:RNA polymerase sigma factor FliA